MSESKKRIVMARFWIGDVVYHIADGNRGVVLSVRFSGDRFSVSYCVVFTDRQDVDCLEMELSAEKVFAGDGDAKATA